eukprot:3679994-Amphidinium_carterae.2
MSQWVLALPLQERQLELQEGLFCQALLIALHWRGPPGSPLSALAVAVPAAACEGIETDVEFVQVMLRHANVPLEEEPTELITVGVLLWHGSELGRLLETTPAESHILAFDELYPEGRPIVEDVQSVVTRWDGLAEPTTITLQERGGESFVVRMSASEYPLADDEGYQSAGDMETPLAMGHMLGAIAEEEAVRSGVLPVAEPEAPPRRGRMTPGTPVPLLIREAMAEPNTPTVHASGGVERKAASSLVGAGTKVGASPLGGLPPARPGVKSAAARVPPATKRVTKPKALGIQSQMQEQQAEILKVLGGIQGRIGALETSVTSIQSAPQHAGVPSLLSPCLGGAALPVARPMAGAPSPSGGSAAYQSMLADARRALPGVPAGSGLSSAHVMPGAETSGAAGRSRGIDQSIRDAVMGGGQSASAALQLATLEVLERLAGKDQKKEPETLEEHLWGAGASSSRTEADDTAVGGAKGQHHLLRLQRLQQTHPQQWSALTDMAASKAVGSDTTGLPWSMELYGRQRLSFSARQQDLPRCWLMLCALHSLSRQGDYAALDLRITQFLKAVEQATLQNGWSMAWLLTGLADPSPSQVGNSGLAHPQEMAAAVQQVKDRKTLQEALRKVDQEQGSEGAGGNQNRRRFPKGGPPPPQAATNSATQQQQQQNQRGGQ